ncbi:MAG TPA: tetratricopeptide repeat protein [Vicinamibacterales bacterium]|nr:tetratricopeptide repeat protein [Vicinamibacterales bacterium]
MSGDTFKDKFANAYLQAAQADANMREAAAALEAVRDRLNARASYHEVLSTIEEQIGQVDLQRLAPAISEFRKAYTRAIVESETDRLKQAFSRDASSGWQAWLTTYAQLFQEGAWRTEIGRQLANGALVSSASADWPVARVQRFAWLICRERWPEAYDWFVFLGEQDIPAELRARMIAITAEIQLYRFVQPTKAAAMLTRAEQVCPGEHVTARARAEMCFEAKDIEGAKRRYQSIAEKKPRLADGFLGLAECADAEGDASGAEGFYQQALRVAPGMTSAQRGLMNWYSKRLDERERLIMPIFNRLLILSDDEPGECMNLALAYKKAGKYSEARHWLDKCVELQPDNGLGEVWNGHNDRDEASNDASKRDALLASAQAHFEKDLEICPEGLDGPWGMMCVAWDLKDWASARTWCNRALAVHPEWESSILVRRASFALETADWINVDVDLRRSMELEPQNPGATDALLDFADKLVSMNRPYAEQVLARWREAKGEPAEYLYQNRLGNWHYSDSDYEAAAEHYRRAVQAAPDRPVIRSNYALAAEALRTRGDRLKWLDEGIASLTEASRLDSSQEEYKRRLLRLRIEREFIQFYGESALDLSATVTPLRVEVRSDEVKAILDAQGNNLSPETTTAINAWRGAVLTRIGVALPGVNFTTADDLEPGHFRMSVMEKATRVEQVGDAPLISAILKAVEALCTSHILEFLGHQESANLLRAANTPATLKILETPRLLTRFVMSLRQLLMQGQPITDIEGLATKYLATHGGLPEPAGPPESVSPAPAAQQG